MKFLFLLSVIVVAAVIYFYFFGNLNQSIYLLENNNSSSSAAAHTNQTPLNKNSAGPGSPASSGFKGPTGKPHIIGPSGPPPNY